VQTLSPITGLIVGASDCTLFARILGQLAIPITPASVDEIAYTVTNLTTGFQISTGTIPNTAVLNSLVQNDPLWTQDSSTAPGPDGQYGYNFLTTIPAAALPGIFPNPLPVPVPTAWAGPPVVPFLPTAVRIDVFFTMAGGAQFRIPFEPDIVVPVWG
jgi:hypothetical protein